MTILDSLRDLAESSHLLAARDFAQVCEACDRGASLDSALERLKANFGLAICDLTIETLRMVNSVGGAGFVSALAHQTAAIRERSLLNEQIQAKQGWVLGTAKIAVVAPWLIVFMLATRGENAESYNSLQGAGVLLAGLAASILALRLISHIGRLETNLRVLA
jgi:tight adherence protein B